MIVTSLVLILVFGSIIGNENHKTNLAASYTKNSNIRVHRDFVIVDGKKFTGKVYSYNANGMTFVLEIGKY
jgi:hypothetical protein